MASAYALPVDDAHRHTHSYSHSHLASRSVSKFPSYNSSDATNSTFSVPRVDGNLFTHQEASRESSPNHHHQHHQSVRNHDRQSQDTHVSHESQTAPTFPRGTQHNHTHTTSESPIRLPFSIMKGRARGESDLGRPTASTHISAAQSTPATPTAWLTVREALTALLIPLPYLLASAAYASMHGHGTEIQLHPLPAYAPQQLDAGTHSSVMLPRPRVSHGPSLLEASALTSATLLLVGAISKSISAVRTLDRRKDPLRIPQRVNGLMTMSFARSAAVRALSLGLPFYAAMQLGGLRVGLVLLMSIAANLTCADLPLGKVSNDVKKELASRGISVAIFVVSMVLDLSGWTFHASFTDVALGYLALACSIILLHPPLPAVAIATTSRATSRPATALAVTSPWNSSATSPLVSSSRDQDITLLAGVVMSLVTLGMSILWSSRIFELGPAMVLSILAVLTMSGAILFSTPSSIRSKHKTGMAMACLLSASVAFLFSPELWPGTIFNGGLSALSFIGVLYDTNGVELPRSHDEHAHEHSIDHHTHNDHQHQHEHVESYSAFTKFMIGFCRPGSLAHGILCEKDSRRIAYFTTYVIHRPL
nr:hypothetical protein CFP56_02479 [Quercus suber]